MATQSGTDQSTAKVKKVHWTQTPKGRKIMADHARMRAIIKKNGGKKNGAVQEEAHNDLAHHISFLAGSISKEITNYAASTGVSRTDLAEGIRRIL